MEWTVVECTASKDDDQEEEETARGKTGDDPCNQMVDNGEVFGEGTTEEEERDLEHDGEQFYDDVEVPCGHPINLTLSVPVAINEGPVRINLGVTIEPLFSKHGSERREEGRSQA